MKRITATLSVLALLSSASYVMASDIKEQQYGYGYGDTVTSVAEDAFVICDGCTSDKLSKLPKQFVGIKIIDHGPSDPSYREINVIAVQEQPAEVRHHKPTLIGTVFFKFDSERLLAAEKVELDHVIKKIPAGSNVSISGYTCTIGEKEYNQNLSKRRAKKVAAYLEHKGIKVGVVTGKGECCPKSSTDKRLNRRVEIIEKGE